MKIPVNFNKLTAKSKLIVAAICLLLVTGTAIHYLSGASTCKEFHSAIEYIDGFFDRTKLANKRGNIDDQEFYFIIQLLRSGKAFGYSENGHNWRGHCSWLKEVAASYNI